MSHLLSWPDYFARRGNDPFTFYPGPPGATRTVMVLSHIWWTEQIALSLRNAGYHVLVHYPFYALYTEPNVFPNFEALWNQIANTLRQHNVSLILGGNSAALLPHPTTGKLLHESATDRPIPIVNWWWDEPRTRPPFASSPHASFTPQEYLHFLASPHVLNAVWDLDVCEELRSEFHLTNLFHLPLATLPEFWPQKFFPLEHRPLAACFLGHCHFTAPWGDEPPDDPLVAWALRTAQLKLANQDRSMISCADEIAAAMGGRPTHSRTLTGDPWIDFARPWELVNAAWMHFTRHKPLLAAAGKLKGKLALIGEGWQQLGLRANQGHAGDKSGYIYATSKCALNLFGGCVHSGMPLRPFDITASSGLLLTHYQRELPSLFSPDECLSFRTPDQLVTHLDVILTNPAQFNPLVQAAHQRTFSSHSWTHRLTALMAEVDKRFVT